jgi:alcohol dehydrogenase
VAIPHADANLVRLPDELDFVAAASLGCRFVTAFRAVVVQGRPAPGQWLAVHGCGGLGLAAIMIGHAMGVRVIGIDVKAAALGAAKSLGAIYVVDASHEPDLPRRLRELTEGGAHVSIDALGSRQTCRNSILCLRKRGRHVQVGLMQAEDSDVFLPMGPVIGKELEIYGSHGMQAHAYGPMLEMIRTGQLQPARLVKKNIPLAEAPAELESLGHFQTNGVTVITEF